MEHFQLIFHSSRFWMPCPEGASKATTQAYCTSSRSPMINRLKIDLQALVMCDDRFAIKARSWRRKYPLDFIWQQYLNQNRQIDCDKMYYQFFIRQQTQDSCAKVLQKWRSSHATFTLENWVVEFRGITSLALTKVVWCNNYNSKRFFFSILFLCRWHWF